MWVGNERSELGGETGFGEERSFDRVSAVRLFSLRL